MLLLLRQQQPGTFATGSLMQSFNENPPLQGAGISFTAPVSAYKAAGYNLQ
jgi:hypothetical protein